MEIEEQIKILDSLIDVIHSLEVNIAPYSYEIDKGYKLLEYLKAKKEDGKG